MYNKLLHGRKIRQDLMTTILKGIRLKVEAKGEQQESYVDNRLLYPMHLLQSHDLFLAA